MVLAAQEMENLLKFKKGVLAVYFIYNILLGIFTLIYLPVIIYKIFKGRYQKEIKERFGILPETVQKRHQNQPTVWFHAVSVGETVAASSIVEEFRARHPEYKIIFSTVTDTGQEMAHKIIEDADSIIYFPLDFSWVVKRALKAVQPDMLLIMETELWPNMVKAASDMGIKVMYANGRISDKSVGRYKYLGPLLQDMLGNIDILSMQSKQDVEHIIQLGAASEKVFNNGNTKFDQTYAEPDSVRENEFYEEFKIEKNQPVFVAGSTHDDEEERLISVYQKIKSNYEDFVFILAPRHIERVDQIKKTYDDKGIATVRRTNIERRKPGSEDVIILDTIGELAQIYSIADLVFVGGSMMGKGGHNILEPAAHGKPVLFGPDMFNFKDSTRLLLENEVGIQVETYKELTDNIIYYLENDQKRQIMGQKARKIITQNRGASQRNVDLAEELLEV